MSLLNRLRLRFAPPRIRDPEFGELTFMYIPQYPERSYWEASWTFPPTGTAIHIDLLGTSDGPLREAKEFYLTLPSRFATLLRLVRPSLDQVFREWYDRPIADDIWRDVKLAGFSLDDPRTRPLQWDISFEATGQKWLGIVIPFRDDAPGTPVVDT